MKECLRTCRDLEVSCPVKQCKYWIKFPSELNCSLESINQNYNMTLREVAERLKISFVRVKQIEDAALKKIGRLLKKQSI